MCLKWRTEGKSLCIHKPVEEFCHICLVRLSRRHWETAHPGSWCIARYSSPLHLTSQSYSPQALRCFIFLSLLPPPPSLPFYLSVVFPPLFFILLHKKRRKKIRSGNYGDEVDHLPLFGLQAAHPFCAGDLEVINTRWNWSAQKLTGDRLHVLGSPAYPLSN